MTYYERKDFARRNYTYLQHYEEQLAQEPLGTPWRRMKERAYAFAANPKNKGKVVPEWDFLCAILGGEREAARYLEQFAA